MSDTREKVFFWGIVVTTPVSLVLALLTWNANSFARLLPLGAVFVFYIYLFAANYYLRYRPQPRKPNYALWDHDLDGSK